MPKAWSAPEPLFNGKDLTGWEVVGNPANSFWIARAGELVNDYSPSKSPSGRIGLQIHGGQTHDHVIKFRHIEITTG